ncbi:geobacillin-26 family protein [Anaerobacillus arseniciselenatis]|uniref:geobacillin-26 family protein n=1 Tax=Anaerobacillus arseniciselenatis TaxID=85682 RepID=UPI00111446DC|nr:geobacillin-26 family protein [Anaerobacillus arseniciselenatis]
MRKKIFGLFCLFIIFFIVLIPIVSASSLVIDEGKARGYHYTVIKEQNEFKWEVGYHNEITIITENENNNNEVLQHFRKAVNEINTKIFQIIVSISYILLVVTITIFFYKRNKELNKGSGAIIVIFAGIGLIYAIVNFIYLNTAFRDAEYYYSIILTR